MITITFRCGHRVELTAHVVSSPVCPECGADGVSAIKAPPPRFRGTVTGPLAVKESPHHAE